MNVGCIKRDNCQAEVIVGCDACSATLCQRCSITWCENQGSEYNICQKKNTEGWFFRPENAPELIKKLSDHDIVENIKKEKKAIEEELTTLDQAMDQARKDYTKDVEWFGKEAADMGYLDSLREHYSSSKAILRTLNRLLGIPEEKQP